MLLRYYQTAGIRWSSTMGSPPIFRRIIPYASTIFKHVHMIMNIRHLLCDIIEGGTLDECSYLSLWILISMYIMMGKEE